MALSILKNSPPRHICYIFNIQLIPWYIRNSPKSKNLVSDCPAEDNVRVEIKAIIRIPILNSSTQFHKCKLIHLTLRLLCIPILNSSTLFHKCKLIHLTLRLLCIPIHNSSTLFHKFKLIHLTLRLLRIPILNSSTLFLKCKLIHLTLRLFHISILITRKHTPTLTYPDLP